MTDAYPLAWPEGWPRARFRAAGKFRKAGARLTIGDAMKRVRYELDRLGVKSFADDVVISTNVKVGLGGFPRGDSQQRIPDPGVAVYWQLPKKPMRVMAIDEYTTVADNLAAIAATLEAMRAIERHGGARILDRAFAGFQALPAAGPDCWTVLGKHPASQPWTAEEVEAAYRRLAKTKHPDAGGTHAAMSELNGARDEALRKVRERA
jgi:hypothetical protein